jgi:hypothetical protein
MPLVATGAKPAKLSLALSLMPLAHGLNALFYYCRITIYRQTYRASHARDIPPPQQSFLLPSAAEAISSLATFLRANIE